MSVKRIAKNSAVLFLLRFLQYGFTALFSIYAARLLGTTGFGKFSFAFSYTTFFLVFADFGLSTLINQKVSRYRDATNKLFRESLVVDTSIRSHGWSDQSTWLHQGHQMDRLSSWPLDFGSLVYCFFCRCISRLGEDGV